ncbi:class I adenylate-forming enzyme family protein [Botrimarina sp.]|uniref:class I adenylate-forming enzyme family protein n=1 Tax=Botrimarina sp. TaxID=2795802 RepID=UPI0032EFAFDA
MSPAAPTDLRPDPILDAVEGYRGSFVDLHDNREVDARQFHTARTALARRLIDAGLEAGDRVVVAVTNGPQFVATLAALLRCGGSPVLAHALTPAAELRRTALRFGARFVVTDGPPADELGAAIGSAAEVAPAEWLRVALAACPTDTAGFVSGYPALPGVPLHQTSGTTGVPKLAVRPGAAAVAEARHYIDTAGVGSDDTILVTSPMSHAYAYGMGVMVPLLSGARIVSLREFKPATVLDAFASLRVTIFPAAPALLEVLMFGAGDRLKQSPPTVFVAGAPLTERVARTYRERSGVVVRSLYGTTETGGISIVAGEPDATTAGCVGPPMRGVEAQARPSGHAEEQQQHLTTLRVRSESMMTGYLTPEGIDRSCLDAGWFDTGDLASIDARGSIHLRGRMTEVINVGGLKVVPSEVEQVIATLPGVREVKVYAGQSRSGAQFVKAAVVGEPSVTDTTVRDHCKEQLVYFKRPSVVLLLDALPKTPSGKVLVRELP